jgi:hypothetical protein
MVKKIVGGTSQPGIKLRTAKCKKLLFLALGACDHTLLDVTEFTKTA